VAPAAERSILFAPKTTIFQELATPQVRLMVMYFPTYTKMIQSTLKSYRNAKIFLPSLYIFFLTQLNTIFEYP
jgi:hypothetical protein